MRIRVLVTPLLLLCCTAAHAAVVMPDCNALGEMSLILPDEQFIESSTRTPIEQWTERDIDAFEAALLNCRALDPEFRRISDDQFFRDQIAEFMGELRDVWGVRVQQANAAAPATELLREASAIRDRARGGPLPRSDLDRLANIKVELDAIQSSIDTDVYVDAIQQAYEVVESALLNHGGAQLTAEFESSVEADRAESERLAAVSRERGRIIIGLAEATWRNLIDTLGLPPQVLESRVKLWDWFRHADGSLAPYDWGSMRTWLSLMLDSGMVSSPVLASAGDAYGVTLVFRDRGTMTVLFEFRDGDLYLSHVGNQGRQAQRLTNDEEVATAQELSYIGHEAVAVLLKRFEETPPTITAPASLENNDQVFGFEGQYRNAQNGVSCVAEGEGANIIQIGGGRIMRNGNSTAMSDIALNGEGWTFDVAMQLPTGDVSNLKGEIEANAAGMRLTIWNERSGEAAVTQLVPCE